MQKQLLFVTFLFAGCSLSVLGQSHAAMSMSHSDSTMVMSDSVQMIHPIESSRPLRSERPAITPKGYFQMEHEFKIEDTDPGFIYSYPSSVWKVGVTNNFEFRVITEYITVQKEPNPDINGFLPLGVGIKAKLGEQKGILPKISFVGDLTLPGVVGDEFETTYLAPDVRLAFEHKVSKLFEVGYNLGLKWDGINAEPDFTYSLYTDFNITNHLGLYVEGYGTTPQRDDVDMEVRIDAGLSYLIGNDFLVFASAGKGLTDAAVESFVSGGFSYRFKL